MVVRLDQPAPTRCRVVPTPRQNKARRRGSDDPKESGASCTLCHAYSNMLHVEFLARGNEIVVVEQPWEDVEASLPGALERHVYGT